MALVFSTIVSPNFLIFLDPVLKLRVLCMTMFPNDFVNVPKNSHNDMPAQDLGHFCQPLAVCGLIWEG